MLAQHNEYLAARDRHRQTAGPAHLLRLAALLIAVLLLLLSVPSATAQLIEAQRGQLLYESACTECHTQSVHSRQSRVAKTFEEVREFVARWSAASGLRWNEQQIHDVSVYLNQRYYNLRCTTPDCKRQAAQVPGVDTDHIRTLADLSRAQTK